MNSAAMVLHYYTVDAAVTLLPCSCRRSNWLWYCCSGVAADPLCGVAEIGEAVGLYALLIFCDTSCAMLRYAVLCSTMLCCCELCYGWLLVSALQVSKYRQPDTRVVGAFQRKWLCLTMLLMMILMILNITMSMLRRTRARHKTVRDCEAS